RNGHAFVAAQSRLRHGRGREIEIDVVGGEQIEANMTVVIEERAAAAPARLLPLRRQHAIGDIFECAVATVVKQLIPAPRGYEEIVVAVVVVVCGAGALS